MKSIFFSFLLIIGTVSIYGQCRTKEEILNRRKIFTKVDVMPTFPGGPDGWRRFLEKSFQIPDNFGNDDCGTQLTYRCSMIIEPDGTLSNLTINDKCDTSKFCVGEKACYYLLKRGPRWVPGKQNNTIVPVRVHQHIGIELGEM